MQQPSARFEIGVLAIYRDEAPYLQEWGDHYRRLGVTRFWLYDNESSDGGILHGDDVETIIWPGEVQQAAAYKDGIGRACDKVEWLVVVDLDEFMYHPGGLDLQSFARAMANKPMVSQVWAPWRMFGWGDHRSKPAGGVVQNYLWRARDDHPAQGMGKGGKSIVRPTHVTALRDPHLFQTQWSTLMSLGLLCNHYWTKSREEALLKWQRGRADHATQRSWEEFEATAEEYSEAYDDRLARLARGE